MNKPTVVSLFSGIGGIDIGFINAGFNVIYANDKDYYVCKTYKLNFPNTLLVEADIVNITAKTIPHSDILTAGFPCQSFSVMGRQRGFNDSRGNLFFEIIRIVACTKPSIVFLENVKNLIYHDDGKTFMKVYNSLAELGYGVKYRILNAAEYGNIPQERSRTFIVAFLDYSVMNRFKFPSELQLTKGINDIINRNIRYPDSFYYHENNKYYAILNSKIIDNVGIYRIDDSGVANKRYNISPTLKANMGTYPDRVPVIRDDFGIRKLTPNECLKLQGFPDDFDFGNIPINQAYKQAGNTVCVPVVERIANNIYRAIKGEEL